MRSLILAVAVLCASTANADLVAFWNFNTLTNNQTTNAPSNANVTSYAADSGVGSLTLAGITGSATGGINNFAGTTVNTALAAPAGQALAIQGSSTGVAADPVVNNGGTLTFAFNLSAFVDPIFTFAARNTATGFGNSATPNTVSYSTDGVTFNPLANSVLTTTFAANTYNLAANNDVDGAANVLIRITLAGATSGSGNMRLDNVQLNATSAVPEAPAALFGLALCGTLGLAWGGRRFLSR